MKKTYYFTNIFPHYRLRTWEALIKSNAFEFHVFFSKQNLNGIKSINVYEHFKSKDLKRFHFLKNYRIKGIIFWQSKVIRKCLLSNFDTAVFLGEMNIISTWIAVLLCRLRNIKIVFWSHGLYGSEGLFKRKFRIAFYKLAHRHLLYENRAKKLMEDSGFKTQNLFVIYNALDYQKQLSLFNQLEKEKPKAIADDFFKNKKLPILIFTGRLTSVKKVNLLIEAIAKNNKQTSKYNLLIVGDGQERKSLEELASKKLKRDSFHFTGAIYNESVLANLLYYADLCVSPGNVGLTGIHVLSYGTPVCTHDNFANQMPEVEAVKQGQTGIFFEEDNVESLNMKINEWFEKYHQTISRKDIRRIVDEKYNPNYQLKVFQKAIS